MSVRHDLTCVKGDSFEFKIKFDGAITGIEGISFGIKSNYRATNYAVIIRYGVYSADGEITSEGNGVYDCLLYASTTNDDSMIATNYVYEIKVKVRVANNGEDSDTRVYTPVYGQFKLLPNVIMSMTT